jgi:hypothetical protein
MGFEILAWQDGDEDRYEVFEITRDAKWTPRRYLKDESSEVFKDVLVANRDIEEFQDAIQDFPNDNEGYNLLVDEDVSSIFPCGDPNGGEKFECTSS